MFVSEMPIEEEEEEEIDEDVSIDGMEDVENFINEDDESYCTLDEDEVREVLATAWKQKRQEILKDRLRRGFGKPSKSTATSATRKFRSEVEELQLKTKCHRCGTLGKRMSAIGVKGGGRGNHPGRKMNIFQKKTRRRTSVTGALETNDDSSVSFRVNTAPCLTGFADREQRCSLLEKARKLRLERIRVCGEFETMLNSCPGKGIVGTGCAKMMLGSDTFQQHLNL